MNAASTDPTGAGTIVLIHGLWGTRAAGRGGWTTTRPGGLQSDHPGLAGLGRRCRGPPRDHSASRKPAFARWSTATSRSSARSSPPIIMGHSFGGASRRSCSTAGWAPPASPSIRRRQGRRPLPPLPSALGFGPGKPRQQVRRFADRGSSTTPSPTPSTTAVPRRLDRYAVPGPGNVLLPGRAGEPQPPRGRRRSTSATTRTTRRCSSSPAARTTSSRRRPIRHNADEVRRRVPRRVQGVPGPAALPGRSRLGRGRRLRPRLGCSERDGPADGVSRSASGRDMSAV